jgi:phytoene dehydrogenase-like protein
MVAMQDVDVDVDVDVVVGGGISGLLAGLLLAERGGRKVIVIERENQVGGLLRCFDYGKYGFFDYGMHNMYETGIAPLDELLFGLLPKDDWQLLERGARDLAGVIFNGRVQHNSPFPDLRYLPPQQWGSCVLGFFRQLETQQSQGHGNAWEDVSARFGTAVAEIIDAALRKQFGKPAQELAPFATRLTTLSRVVMFSETPFADFMESSELRARLAWPEQRTLPPQWESGRKSYYPRKYGMYRVINALLARLRAAGVEVLTSAKVQSLESDGVRVKRLMLEHGGVRKTIVTHKLVWTSGLPAVAKLLGLDLSDYSFDPPRKTVIVNLLLRQPPQMGDLYYLYCYEPGCNTFRITNFTGYCEGAPRAGGWPIAVELLIDEPNSTPEAMKRLALDELTRFKVIASDGDVIFSAVEPLASGFPMPSVNNFKALSDMRERIAASRLSNLTLLGILSEENVFFQRDVLTQTWNKLIQQEKTNG